ncbi:hypothetical protein [Escherichia coli]|uniref:hypothetical protein n=1 Tax=Escherichia coli TaxID=562 RepID=UPI00180D2C77|nr:hypothetical protein [Escherichia coli]MCD9327598.1 hypothetical protein [Escherichia coli]MCX9794043.1 hypothetical protein [Escherichia coli]HAJ6910565.1 hypothetical protein [Escherichia coli]
MKKILFIESHNGKISGAQKVTLNVAKLLSERGDDLTVMYPGSYLDELALKYKSYAKAIKCYKMPSSLGSGGFDGLNVLQKIQVIIVSFLKMIFFILVFPGIQGRINLITFMHMTQEDYF